MQELQLLPGGPWSELREDCSCWQLPIGEAQRLSCLLILRKVDHCPHEPGPVGSFPKWGDPNTDTKMP